jgi:phenylalanyl-tRNA synthetase alpha chain
MADLRTEILHILNSGKESITDTLELCASRGWVHQEVVGALRSLEALEFVVLSPKEVERWQVTSEGRDYAMRGLPEIQVVNFVKSNPGCTSDTLNKELGALAKIGMGAAMKVGLIRMDKATNSIVVGDAALADGEYPAGSALSYLSSVGEKDTIESVESKVSKSILDELKKRKLIQKSKTVFYSVSKGPNFSLEIKKSETALSVDMVQKSSNTWKNVNFKQYNLNALGADIGGGSLHPLLKVKTEIRNILMNMGFEEMPTNKYMESSFWNFDSLFQPQQHPARDAHDTFFITSPARAEEIPADYLAAVKEMHEIGGAGSIGWRYDWSEEESRKNILRTHTTAVSARVLYEIGQEYKKTGTFRPRKCFSIDRVFRNESLDATHLAEFHQVEGFVVDYGLNLANLIGEIKEFFRRMGMEALSFKPAYNPYTEPSMEIFAYHPGLKKRIELGNSGIFRPEMLAPMGFPENVSVIAWGLSVERPTMIKYGISNIRDLFGHKMDVASLKYSPLCWFNESREEDMVSNENDEY